MESADIVLMRSDLMDVSSAIQLSRRTMVNIKQNLFWAFAYNTAGIPIAAGLLHLFGGPTESHDCSCCYGIQLHIRSDNALRLKKFKPSH